MKCTECDRVLSIGGVVDADRLEDHRLWRHPSPVDVSVVMHEITAFGQQTQLAFDARDWLNLRLVLGSLHDRVLRAMTYADIESTKAVA